MLNHSIGWSDKNSKLLPSSHFEPVLAINNNKDSHNFYNFHNIKMSSPSKRVDLEKDNTMFGQLTGIEVNYNLNARNWPTILTNRWLRSSKLLTD